jgi:hypothetical protein
MSSCPICGTLQISKGETDKDAELIHCVRCGDFLISRTAVAMVLGLMQERPRGRFAASHAIRRAQSSESNTASPQEIDSERLKLLWASPIPNPQRQADLLILFLGDADLPFGQHVRHPTARFSAEIGTEDDITQGQTGGFLLITRRLIEEKFVENLTHGSGISPGYRLTFDGWARYEHLRREVILSRTAFMAMGYGNPNLDRVVSDYFIPAVKETGFELFRLDDRPKSGLIDNRMRVEIKSAKFLVCDLSDDNRGAYWESGFAEGAEKPVFYTCDQSKFGAAKKHFDTEHMFTVLWTETNLTEAAEQLKAAIRRDFPSDAIMPDRAAGRS